MSLTNMNGHAGEWGHAQNIHTDGKCVPCSIDLRSICSDVPLQQAAGLTLAVFILLFNEKLAMEIGTVSERCFHLVRIHSHIYCSLYLSLALSINLFFLL